MLPLHCLAAKQLMLLVNQLVVAPATYGLSAVVCSCGPGLLDPAVLAVEARPVVDGVVADATHFAVVSSQVQ